MKQLGKCPAPPRLARESPGGAAGNIVEAADVRAVVFHESVGHYGLNGFFRAQIWSELHISTHWLRFVRFVYQVTYELIYLV